MTEMPADDPDASMDERVRAIHNHLVATAELPIDRETNRWLGEAEAVARDAATNELDRPTTEKRIRQVRSLLDSASDPDHEEAAAHLENARNLAAAVVTDDDEPGN